MKTTVLLGIAALTIVALGGGILPASGASAEPQPGRIYYVVYNQTDGSITAAGSCPASLPLVTCTPILQPGQSVLWITDNPALVNAFFTDLESANPTMQNWHVNMQTHQLERLPTTSGPVTTPVFGVTSIQVMLPALTLIGAALSTAYVRRRAHKQSF